MFVVEINDFTWKGLIVWACWFPPGIYLWKISRLSSDEALECFRSTFRPFRSFSTLRSFLSACSGLEVEVGAESVSVPLNSVVSALLVENPSLLWDWSNQPDKIISRFKQWLDLCQELLSHPSIQYRWIPTECQYLREKHGVRRPRPDPAKFYLFNSDYFQFFSHVLCEV